MIIATDFVAPVITALGVLLIAWFKHRVDMRKQDAEDKAADRAAKEREAAAEALRRKEVDERAMARMRLEAQLRAINDKQQSLADQQVVLNDQLQTNTHKLDDLQRMTRDSQFGGVGGGK